MSIIGASAVDPSGGTSLLGLDSLNYPWKPPHQVFAMHSAEQLPTIDAPIFCRLTTNFSGADCFPLTRGYGGLIIWGGCRKILNRLTHYH